MMVGNGPRDHSSIEGHENSSTTRIRRPATVLAFWLLLSICCSSNALSESSKVSRRKILGTLSAATGLFLLPNEPANAAKGAAELDFEYYMRDLVGGNKREGTVLPSAAPKAVPPRTLTGPLIPLLLDKDCTPLCIPVQALILQIQKQSGNSKSEESIAQEIQSKVKNLREKISKSFYARTPWQEESVMDQYYFDVTSYALWRTAAELLPNFVERDKFMRTLGKLLYQKMQTSNLVTPPVSTTTASSLVKSLPAALEVLQLFQSSNFCKGYKIRQDDGGKDDGDPIFDELDDESLELSGLSVDCLVSVYEPATLGASLQINGEQSRFAPDLVGITLAAIWDDAGIKSSWETFFVDPEYRPNPKDYFANEQVSNHSQLLCSVVINAISSL